MWRWLLALCAMPLLGHDIITTRITWAREISRVVQHRCASCHRPEGSAPMSLLTYDEARPWARAIAEEVLERRMPPWNPVKGFGSFRHEAGLTQEEITLISEWVEGGAPRGEDRYLPLPAVPPKATGSRLGRIRLLVQEGLVLPKAFLSGGILVSQMAEGQRMSAWAELPDGENIPLIEIAHFRPGANEPYEFARPLRLPAGTRIRIDGAAGVALISSSALPARRSER